MVLIILWLHSFEVNLFIVKKNYFNSGNQNKMASWANQFDKLSISDDQI